MKALILAAGKSSRFYPFSNFVHKSCAPLLGKPIFIHTLKSIRNAGITEVIVVTGKTNVFKEIVDSEEDLGLSIQFIEQPEPLGMGDAILQAKDYIDGDFFLLHPHHVEFSECAKQLEERKKEAEDIVLLSQEEEVVEKYGVLRLENDKVVEIVEKPKKGEEPSHFRIVGMYLLNKQFVETLQKMPSHHYNFEQALTEYAKEHTVQYAVSGKNLSSLKYPWDILQINRHLLEQADEKISESAEIGKNVTISGNVVIEDGVTVHEGVVIKGPCYIGKNTIIGNNAVIRDFVTIGESCVIGANMEVKNTVFFNNSTTHSGFIGASVIGEGSKIAAFICTANVRLDRKTVKVKSENGEIDSGLKQLGVILGNNARVGIRVSTMPGIIIGNEVTIGPSTTVIKNIDDGVTYYTKFKEIIEKKDDRLLSSTDMSSDNKLLVLFDIDYTLFNTGTFKESNLTNYELYEEVIDTLVMLGKKARLGIFSEGILDFQRQKLLKTDIYDHFLDENIHIVQSKDETIKDLLEQYKDENIFLIDDKLTVLHAARSVAPQVKTIWVKRGIYAENQKDIDGFTPDAVVRDLRDITTIVEELSNS